MDNEFDDDVACSLLFMSFDFHFQPTVGLITFPGMRRPRVCMPASLRSFFTVSGVRRDLSLDRWRGAHRTRCKRSATCHLFDVLLLSVSATGKGAWTICA